MPPSSVLCCLDLWPKQWWSRILLRTGRESNLTKRVGYTLVIPSKLSLIISMRSVVRLSCTPRILWPWYSSSWNLLKVSINDFFIVTNLLHIHMKQNAVMPTEFNNRLIKMEEVCKLAMALAEKARVTTDKAKQLADKAKKWAKKVVKVSMDVIKERSGSTARRKREGGNRES